MRKRESGAIYSNLTPDSVALNNRHRLRWDWSPFNNGLLSNELVLSVRNGPGRAGILPPVSRCCDSKELEINLGYNNFFCGPRPTTRINQISSFRASALSRRASSFFPIVVLDSRCTLHLHRDATRARRPPNCVSEFFSFFLSLCDIFCERIALCIFDAICELNVYTFVTKNHHSV